MSAKRVLVYGGSGALGDTLVSYFKNKNYWIVSIDLKDNSNANENILVDANKNLVDQEVQIVDRLNTICGDQKFDAIFNVAGGWAGGNASTATFLSNSNLMWNQSVGSSLITSSLACKYLRENGVLTLSGAAASLDNQATPTMIGYGLAKAAVHQLVKSLASEQSGLPANTFVAAICPICLDTPMNRKWMPTADFKSWTSLNYIAELFDKWLNSASERPSNGSIIKLTTANDETVQTYH